MQVVLHDHMKKPQRIRATRIVVEDDFGNPIGLFIQTSPTHIAAEIADGDEQKFNRALRQFGINKTLVIDVIKPKPPQGLIV